MSNVTTTTITGLLKGIGVATATLATVQNDLVFWIGLAYAILTAVQGYLTNRPEK